MTSLEQERREQQRWTDRLKRPVPVYDALIEGEFESPERAQNRQASALSRMLRFSSQCVPYYRELFQQIGIDPASPEPFCVLEALPILTKPDLRDNQSALRAERLPNGARAVIEVQSSGTTGIPVKTLHSLQSARMFSLLKQREYRWFRFDPAGTMAIIRFPGSLPRDDDGRELGEGESMTLPAWTRLKSDFATGPAIAFSVTNPAERQIEWLQQNAPDYLLSFCENLEHLALAAGDQKPAPSLKSAEGITDQMTPAMRAHVERSFGIPVHQNYGLNEIGLVATRCEASRYHVHSEHCIVEIIGSDGRSAAPGETGRLVITGLTNWAMPLLRYDADDLATAVEGGCLCGRTLPSFGDISGRYSRVAFLPPGTLGAVEALRMAILELPAALVRDLRQFQIHQSRDNSFEVRLVMRTRVPEFSCRPADCRLVESSERTQPAIFAQAGGEHRTATGR